MINYDFVTNVEQAFHVKLGSQIKFNDKVLDWQNIYAGRPDWLGGKNGVENCLNVASFIISDLAKKSVCEITLNTDSKKAEAFFQENIKPQLRQQLEYALAMGSVVAKPYYDEVQNNVKIQWFTADKFIPTSWDNQQCTGGIFMYQTETYEANRAVYWTLMEKHQFTRRFNPETKKTEGIETIEYKCFKGFSEEILGGEWDLSQAPEEWRALPKRLVIDNLSCPCFVYIKTPFTNNVNFNTNYGVSIYKDAVKTLERIDRAWDNLNWEMESSKNRIFVAQNSIPTVRDRDGKLHTTLSSNDSKVYCVLDVETDKMMDAFSPVIRQHDITAILKTQISLFCSACHLDSGAYVYEEAKDVVTAKEIRSKEQKTYQTICDIQEWMITPAITNLMKSSEALMDAFGCNTLHSPRFHVDYGDSILLDEETERLNAQAEVMSGLRSKKSYLMEYRNMTESEADEEIMRIKEDAPKDDGRNDGNNVHNLLESQEGEIINNGGKTVQENIDKGNDNE